MDIRVQGYENQVKLFLVLLVLFLAAAGVVSLNALYRTQALLLEEAEARITATTRGLQREVIRLGLAAPATSPAQAAQLGPRLADLQQAYAVASLEIVGLDGRVVAAAEPWRVGVIDPIAALVGKADLGTLTTGGAVIREGSLEGEDAEYGPDRGEVFVFLPLTQDAGQPAALIKAGHEVMGVRTVTRQIRLLAWMQAAAGLIMVALVLLFVRWVLRPYRELKAAASQIGPAPPGGEPQQQDDPAELISSFRGVISKLKDQEVELDRMRALSSLGGPAVLTQPMLDGLTSGVMIIGAEGAVKALNPAGESILGAPRERIVGRDIREAFASSPGLLAILADGVEAGRGHSREVVAYVAPGGNASSPAHLGVTVSGIPASSPGGGGAFCLFSDLTEIRGLQERVRLKENLAGLGEMSAGIAHEFRNSLATILGYARLIGRGARTEEAESAAAIAREVQSIGRIVDDFLRYARPAALQASQWDPRVVMEEVAEEIARGSGRPGVSIVVSGAWPRAVRADEGLIRQAFQNLLRNAVEAIPSESGLVTVTGSLEEGGQLLRVEVADSGTGIPTEVLERLFTPFVTTKERGTGLGLALAQKAIVSHDGAITARNVDDGGACFTVRLPIQE